ncbi:uncharacterized protein LOC121406226 [Lytechinus variegatus]|uniref:uncharacterized protein LOC121406226 n=1 Tax=Lytechinus variegatus TaxID=7654 RepID=UPI001BB29D87|nr:uncharacterized protein LOC121406226 [Lytechinus variegatus]
MSGEAVIHSITIQAYSRTLSPTNIQLSWTMVVAASKQGGQEERFPLYKCRNKISCDVHLTTSSYLHGNPVVMVTASYEKTPWIKTVLHVSIPEQDETEVLQIVPRQTWRNKYLEHQTMHKSPRQLSRRPERPRRDSGTPRGYKQPISSWKSHPQLSHKQKGSTYPSRGHLSNPSGDPLENGQSVNYRQRIQSEFIELQKLQKSLHQQEKQNHQRREQSAIQQQNRLHIGRIMKKFQDLRQGHIKTLNRLTPGKGHRYKSPSSHNKKPPKIIPNYYPFVPHSRTDQTTIAPHVTTEVPPTEKTTLVTTTAAQTTEATTRLPTTTTVTSPIYVKPMSNRERMKNDRMVYQRLRSEGQGHASKIPRTAGDYGASEGATYNRVSSTYRGYGFQTPKRSEYPEVTAYESEEDLYEYDSVGTTDWDDDAEMDTKENKPEVFQDEESRYRLSQEETTSSTPMENEFTDHPSRIIPSTKTSANVNTRSVSWDSEAEYSQVVSTDYGEIEDENVDYTVSDAGNVGQESGVPKDTWGEPKSSRSKPDQEVLEASDRLLVKEDNSMSAQVTDDRLMPELGMPQTEQVFKALQQDIIAEERNEPEDIRDNSPLFSAEYPDFQQESQGFQAVNNGRLDRLKSAISNRGARVRRSRGLREESTYETSASEPMEYSYESSSSQHDVNQSPNEAMEDSDGRSLNEETFEKMKENILEEERVGGNHRIGEGNIGDTMSSSDDINKETTNAPIRNVERIGSITETRQYDNLSDDNQEQEPRPQNYDVTLEESALEEVRSEDNQAASAEDIPPEVLPKLDSSSYGHEEGMMGEIYDQESGEGSAPQSQSKEWSRWSQCSHSCGHGTKTRHRACTGPNTNTCSSGLEIDAVQCALQKCSSVEVKVSLSEWSDWSEWSVCSASCGSGLSRRERSCLHDPDQEPGCIGEREETRDCRLRACDNYANVENGFDSGGTTRRSDHDHHHHTKRIKCHLDESRSHLPMELYWTSPSGQKITHAMTHERGSKYRIEGTTLVVTEDEPTEGSYHCIVIYGGSSGANNKGKTVPTGACISNPCHHKGVCLDQPDGRFNVSFRCLCPAGTEGVTCHLAPYLKGDAVVFSLLGWFVLSSAVLLLIMYLFFNKKMKKRKMKQKLELDDAPAEKLLAKILPQSEITPYADSDAEEEEEDTKPLLSFRPPQFGKKQPEKKIGKTESTEKLEPSGKGRFKSFVKRMTKSTAANVERMGFPTPKQVKTLTTEMKEQRNQNNSNTLAWNNVESDNSDSYTDISTSSESLSDQDAGGSSRLQVNCNVRHVNSSFESLQGHDESKARKLSVNHNMNNCSWDYSNVSSCAPCDLNSSSIVGNDDDSFLEISTDDVRDFEIANSFSVFKGSPLAREKQAVIDPSLIYGNSNSTLLCSRSLSDELPRASEKHPMFHFEPDSCSPSASCIPERLNNGDVLSRSVPDTSSLRRRPTWSPKTPLPLGIRVRLPPSPPLPVSPSRLPLPPAVQRTSSMFGPTKEHAILERYHKRRKTYPKHVKSHSELGTA